MDFITIVAQTQDMDDAIIIHIHQSCLTFFGSQHLSVFVLVIL